MKFLTVISTGAAELKGGANVLRRFSDQNLTLVDAVGLHLMTTQDSKTCWSTDHRLGLSGVSLVIHQS